MILYKALYNYYNIYIMCSYESDSVIEYSDNKTHLQMNNKLLMKI